jgi:hypothetical protein
MRMSAIVVVSLAGAFGLRGVLSSASALDSTLEVEALLPALIPPPV